MSHQDIFAAGSQLVPSPSSGIPPLWIDTHRGTWARYVEFLTARIRNRGTREIYHRAAVRFGCWCEQRGIVRLEQVNPVVVATYIEEAMHIFAPPTTKQHLSALKMLFDHLTTGHVVPFNPAAAVRGPKHVVKKGKTPVLAAEEARQLLDAIDATTIGGLRDRALIGVMVYSFARVGAVVAMDVADYFQQGKRYWFRLHEKGGKQHEVPAHHTAEAYLDAYLAARGIVCQPRGPLFPTIDRGRHLTERRLHRREVLAMVKRRAGAAGLPMTTCCHTFRATGITTYLRNGGTIEKAAAIAAHESTRTTQLYNRTNDELTLDEIERILI
ncbi:MAG: tyrosine-type recombinase/integrase [Pirellulales bacterium]|nr:tyrosine-type recombinase/integrase [Pirellulales bacterium]